MNSPTPRIHKAAAVAFGVTALGLVAGACGSNDDNSDANAATTVTDGAATTTGGAPAASGTYKDGTYSATGHYITPGGEQQVTVTLTLAKSIITKVDVNTDKTTNPTSKKMQESFAGGISEVVVGKDIDDLDVHKVARSSLTSGGFNDAVDQIKTEAKA